MRYRYDKATGRAVEVAALDVQTPRGLVVGSVNAKRRDYMRAKGVTDASDFSPSWYTNRRKEMVREVVNERKRDVVDVVRRAYGG
jgi:hypothetical protein